MMTQPRNFENVSEATQRIFNKIVERFERKNAKFFHKIVTRTIGTETVKGPFSHQLEFPPLFLEKHAHRIAENVTLEIRNCDKKWPMKISVKHVKYSGKKRVFAYGYNGWRVFVEDNDVKVGDLVVFCLVKFSRFIVFIYKAPVSEVNHNVVNEARNNDERNEDTYDEPEAKAAVEEQFKVVPIEIKCTVCGHAPPSPQFVITMRHSKIVTPGEEISLDVPARFWQVHGQLLPGDELHLQGPINFIMKVKIRRSPDALRPKVRLEEGWKVFSAVNNLKMGDNLLFSLIGPSFFKVEVLERYD